jgi:hypothetical protein
MFADSIATLILDALRPYIIPIGIGGVLASAFVGGE